MLTKGELGPQMKTLTARQRQILDFIDGFGQEHGYAPSIRDIVKGCNISSTSVVDYNLRILEREGLLRRDAEEIGRAHV